MAITRLALTLTLGLLLGSPPLAAQEHAPPADSPAQTQGLPFGALLSEAEMRLLFDAMRDAFIAAMKGEEPKPPPEVSERMERLRQKLEGEASGILREMIEQIQEDLDRALEELQERRPPPPEPKPERT